MHKQVKIVWQFHTIPHPGEAGYETWENKNAYKYTGGANNWMGMTIDQQRGIAYIPIGSASMDFYGGKRKGSDLYADCMLALDAATGKQKWHFQFLHHDTWDYDPSSAPVLLTVNHDGKKIDAVAQTTKTGFVFLFDRDNGNPLFPVVETPMDTVTDLTGEKIWPTQPIPQKPAPQVRQALTQKDVNPYLSKTEYDSVVKLLERCIRVICLCRNQKQEQLFFRALMVEQNMAALQLILKQEFYTATVIKWPGYCRCLI